MADMGSQIKRKKSSPGYLYFLTSVVHELEELNLNDNFFPFDQHPSAMDEGERTVYETCIKVNKIAFG